MRSLNISMDEFEKMTSQAIREIPDDFLEALENVEVFVEEEPDPEVLDELGIVFPGDLLGLYQGVPRVEQSAFSPLPILPHRIILFRRPILRICRNRWEVVEQIKKTLVHEVAHHFGFSDSRLRELGY
jgi:predicted Zn-dependent protease with MMP-like domain